jgi:signal transduction histidine kinase
MSGVTLIISSPTAQKSIILDPAGTRLGRAPECDVILNHTSVSRLHARIYRAPDESWIIEDLGSRNGIIVDGRRVESWSLVPGQKVVLSCYSLALVDRPEGVHGHSFTIVDWGAEEKIVPYRSDTISILGLPLLAAFNAFTLDLMNVSNSIDLYVRACAHIAESIKAFVAVLRLTPDGKSHPSLPEVLAFQSAPGANQEESSVHFSFRALEAACSTTEPIMVRSHPQSDQDPSLTIVIEGAPRVVFAAHLNNVGEARDLLYVDLPDVNMSDTMFDFIEATARQINFVQKNLFYRELQEKEKALRQANRELLEKDRIKDEYVSRVTHDIKGHLGVISSCLAIAADDSGIGTPEKKAELVERAAGRTSQLLSFVVDLLRLTRFRLSGQVQDSQFSLREAIDASLTAVATRATEKNITLQGKVDPTIDMMTGDELSITEIITNLLFNAIKYTPENESISLRAVFKDDQICITITDTGIGIPPEDVDRVFDEFFRAGNAVAFEKEGTGLGLALVKQIVERHGGSVEAANNPGKGATFTIRFDV